MDLPKEADSYRLQVQALQVSDGYHTMEELYEHRHRLFIALMKIYDNYITPLDCKVRCWKSKIHEDGTMFEGWFIAGMIVEQVPSFMVQSEGRPPYQISYHLPLRYWHLVNVTERVRAPEWDGHTSKDVLERLLRL